MNKKNQQLSKSPVENQVMESESKEVCQKIIFELIEKTIQSTCVSDGLNQHNSSNGTKSEETFKESNAKRKIKSFFKKVIGNNNESNLNNNGVDYYDPKNHDICKSDNAQEENVILKGKLAGLSFKHLVYVKNKCIFFFQKLMPQKMQFQIVMTFQKIDSKCMLSIAG